MSTMGHKRDVIATEAINSFNTGLVSEEVSRNGYGNNVSYANVDVSNG